MQDNIFGLSSMEAYAGTMSNPESLIRARHKSVGFPAEKTVVHKGFIEKVIAENNRLLERGSFAYVDFDLYEPIRLVLEFLSERMPSGAIIIVDDYDFSRVAPHDGPTTTNSSGQFRSLIAARTAEKFLYYDRSPTKSAKRLAVVA